MLTMALVHDEVITRRRNLFVPSEEVAEFMWTHMPVSEMPTVNTRFTFMGVPAVPTGIGYVFWACCTWCGTEELPDKHKCSKCGGPVTEARR